MKETLWNAKDIIMDKKWEFKLMYGLEKKNENPLLNFYPKPMEFQVVDHHMIGTWEMTFD